MLTEDEIHDLFRDTESDRVERKAALTDGTKIKEAICAFANDYPGHGKPGVIFVGQNDDLSCAALEITSRMLETLGGWRGDGNILPFPSMSVAQMAIDGCTVAVVQVEPSENPPVRFQGRTWIRVGPRRAIATAAEENRLVERRQWLNLPRDARGLAEADMSDLDLRRFQIEYLPAAFGPEILAANGRTIEEQLRSLHLVDRTGHPNIAAILAVGLDPTAWIPGAYIQFLALTGVELTSDIRDQKRITGTVSDQLRQIDELVDLLIVTPARIGSIRTESPTYPAAAIQQTIRNAVLHRNYFDSNTPIRFTWYSDRIEISSPGGLFGGVTSSNFGQAGVADYRNPTLAEVMRTQGYAERFGLGLQIVRDSLAKNGNPPAEYRIDDHFVHVTIRGNQ
ncbi:putative DNA binding domain-containing protein [Sphingomonadaceae bacterium OTU29MARTA1]|nr:putative DNA binding domain-containing protein [Sphingomonadaceae bacterium OTU29MARTA1]